MTQDKLRKQANFISQRQKQCNHLSVALRAGIFIYPATKDRDKNHKHSKLFNPLATVPCHMSSENSALIKTTARKTAPGKVDKTPHVRPAYELFNLDADRPAAHIATPAFNQDWLFVSARALLTLPIDDAINRTLEHCARSVGADRGWMYEYDDTGLSFLNTHEWSIETATSHVEDLQYMPVSMIAWPHCYMVDHMAIMINDVASLPPVGREMRAELMRQNIKSTLTLPVFFEGRLRAGIGFDATHGPRHWGPEIALHLSCCAQLIAAARYSHKQITPNPRPFDKPAKTPEPQLYIRMNGQVRGVTLVEITALRAARDYTVVFLQDGTEWMDRRPLSVWEGLLPADRFMRIHRSCIVHLRHVHHLDRHAGDSQERWEITIRGINTPWTVSRPYRRDLRYRLGV